MAEKILKIDTEKLKKNYSLNGVTKIEIKDTNRLFGTKNLDSLVKTASATGNALYVTLNDNTKTLLTFTNFKDIQKLPVIVYTETQNKSTKKITRTILCTHEAGELGDAVLPKITPILEPQKGTTVAGSILDDDINLSSYDAKTSKKINVKIDGNVGNDTIKGSRYNDTVKGGDGDDIIYATKGNDVITGGIGDNKIYYGTDAFGDDTINLTKNENLKIIFNGDLEAEKPEYTRGKNKNDLLITTKEGTITVKNYLSRDLGSTLKVISGDKEINVVEDAVLEEVNAESYFELSEKKINARYTGTAIADRIDASGLSRATNVKNNAGVTINGAAGSDVIIGSNYNDTLKGGNGNDTITGGIGNDQLYGELGTNTFIFNTGDGNDTVYSGKGTDILNFNDKSVTQLEYVKRTGKTFRDLVIKYGNNDSVTINNYYDKDGVANSSVKNIENAGRTFNIEQLQKYEGRITESSAETINSSYEEGEIIIADGTTAQTVNGGVGDDIIYASNSTYGCTIYAGAGDDIIYGSNVIRTEGEDKYYTGEGDNTVYAGNSGVTHIYLNSGMDTVYTSPESPTYIYIDEISADGGKDKIYWQGNNETKLFFNNHDYDEIVFTRTVDSNNLFIRYGENNYVMLKDYFLEENENMGTYFSLEPFGKTIDDAIEDKGGVKYYVDGLEGTDENDYIIGTDKGETINAYAGNDYVVPKKGADIINLGSGDDILIKGAGNKTINADSGKNIIYLGDGDNIVNMGTGSDTIHSGTGNNTINFKSLSFDTGDDTYIYGNGNDELVFGSDLSNYKVDRRGSDAVLIRGIKNNVDGQKTVTIDNYNNFTYYANDLIVKTKDTETNLFNISTIIGSETSTDDQVLSTGDGDDNIYTGLGDDTITTGRGTNTVHLYIADSGNNNTYTRQGAELDVFVLEDNSSFDDIKFLKSDDDLIVSYNNGDFENNTVKIIDYYKSQSLHNQHIIFKINSQTVILDDLLNNAGSGSGGGNSGGDTPGDNDNPGGNNNPSELVSIITSAQADVFGTPHKDIITAIGNIRQEIHAANGDDIVYVSNNSYSNMVLTHGGNDIIYGSDTMRIDECDKYYTGPGNNTVYAGNNNPKIYLGYNNDKVYTSSSLESSTDIYIDCINNTGGDIDGGRDTIYWRGCGHTNIIFENNSFANMKFSRVENSNDLILMYGYDNSVTFKDYFSENNENMENSIFIQDNSDILTNTISINDALTEKGLETYSSIIYGTSGKDTLNGTPGNDLLFGNGNDILNGNSGDDTYVISSIYNLSTINDTEGTDTLIIKENLEKINVLFNVQKDGIFANGQNSLYLVSDTAYDNWQASGVIPTSGVVIEDFDVIENISSADGYILTNLDQLKSDVANWLSNANGGLGYADVKTAISSNEDISTLIAIFDNANWTQA